MKHPTQLVNYGTWFNREARKIQLQRGYSFAVSKKILAREIAEARRKRDEIDANRSKPAETPEPTPEKISEKSEP